MSNTDKSFQGKEISRLRKEIEQLTLENTKLKHDAQKYVKKDDLEAAVKAAVKKEENKAYIERHNLVKEHERILAEKDAIIMDVEKANKLLNDKMITMKEEVDKYKKLSEMKVGPARVHQQLRDERTSHSKTQHELVRMQQELARVKGHLEKHAIENNYLRDHLVEKEKAIQYISSEAVQTEAIRNLIAQKDAIIRDKTNRIDNMAACLYNQAVERSHEYDMILDVVPMLRDLAMKGHVNAIIRVNKEQYDLILTEDVGGFGACKVAMDKLHLDKDKVMCSIRIKGNEYAVFISENTPIQICF
jgi:chromosome segregation ATPase